MGSRLYVAETHEIVRLGIEKLVEDSELQLVSSSDSAADAVSVVTSDDVDLVVLDVGLRNPGPFDALESLREQSQQVPVIVLATMENAAHTARSMALGAQGLLYKWATKHEFLQAFRLACSGESLWNCEELKHVVGIAHRDTNSTHLPLGLTQREKDVLEQLGFGLTNQDIAKTLDIGYETVKGHVRQVLRKLNVNDRTQAAIWAVRNGVC